MFTSSVEIFIKPGKSGDGYVSLRRELHALCGGPGGGDGGRGGDIIFKVDDGPSTLTDFKRIRKYVAKDGEPGGREQMHGVNPTGLVIRVPRGTVIKDSETNQVIAGMFGDNRRETILNGGRGSLGNVNFVTPAMQAPRYTQPGQSGRGLWVQLELKVITDVGPVGFLNVRKSTLLSKISNAKPKIVNYHFTTLNPHLDVVDLNGGADFIMADIPGLVGSVSQGVRLGHDFFRHIERMKVLIHTADTASTGGRDSIVGIRAISAELETYNPELLTRPQVIAVNKIDVVYEGSENPVDKIMATSEPEGIKVYPTSTISGEGVKGLLYAVYELLKAVDQVSVISEWEFGMSSLNTAELSYTVEKNENEEFVVEGPCIEKILGCINLESGKGFVLSQNFLKASGILEELEQAGVGEDDIVCMHGFASDYYK